MTPERAIGNLDALCEGARNRLAALEEAARLAQQQWDGLGRVGGQRADHAAALLADVGRALADLAVYAERSAGQIMRLRADPFGTGSGR